MALGLVLAVLIAATLKVAVRRPRAAVAAHAHEPDEPNEPEVSTDPAPSPPRVSAAARREARPGTARSAAAQINGRVLAPTGREISFDNLSVAADDGARTIEARVFPDGRFSLHLPAGQYAVTATVGKWVGTAPSVAARPDTGRELAIQLAEPAAIRGRVRGPDGVKIIVRASLAGRNDWLETTADDDGEFTIEQLIPGRSYDLAFAGTALRTTTARSVTAPADGVAAVVVPLPILRGAIGFRSGEGCPITRVTLHAPGAVPSRDDENDEDDNGVPVGQIDKACRFELPVPDGPTGMILVAAGAGWHLEEPISVPPLGDPDPICLNPPCRADPLEGLARLRISLDGAPPGGGIHGSVTPANGEALSIFGCGSSGRSCQIEALVPGEAVIVKVGSADCAARTQTLVLAAGDNAVTVPCSP